MECGVKLSTRHLLCTFSVKIIRNLSFKKRHKIYHDNFFLQFGTTEPSQNAEIQGWLYLAKCIDSSCVFRHTLKYPVIYMMGKLLKHRVCLDSYSNIISSTERLKMLQNLAVNRGYEKRRHLKWTNKKVYSPRFGRTSKSTNDSNIHIITKLVLKNHRMSLRELNQK